MVVGSVRISAELIELKHDVCPPLLPAPTSFLQLRAIASKQPDRRGKTNFKNLASALLLSAIILNKCVFPFPLGNITVIPWTVSAQRGNTISQRENRIVVQEDGYYLVFGQVLYHSKSSVTKLILRMICSKLMFFSTRRFCLKVKAQLWVMSFKAGALLRQRPDL